MSADRTRVGAALAERVATAALVAAGAMPSVAASVAGAMLRAEAEGNAICGLYYLPVFCGHLRCGKVVAKAQPQVQADAATIRVDARHGFAHTAIAVGLPHLAQAAHAFGVAAMTVANSYNCLALGHHVRPLAEQGLIGLCASTAPASVAPPGATRPVFGTNPIAFAVPQAGGPPIVADQSLSAVTKTEMLMRRARGEPIPLGWAQDRTGQPTTDAAEGLLGSLLPAGGRKGANVMLLVELLGAVLSGSRLSGEASMFSDDTGGPPGVGQFLIALDPSHFAGPAFADGLDRLGAQFAAAGLRFPGRRSLAADGDWRQGEIALDDDLWRRCLALAEAPPAA
ncbi:Ldh family oxidoreductase [Ancylobacter moscoviensis]